MAMLMVDCGQPYFNLSWQDEQFTHARCLKSETSRGSRRLAFPASQLTRQPLVMAYHATRRATSHTYSNVDIAQEAMLPRRAA